MSTRHIPTPEEIAQERLDADRREVAERIAQAEKHLRPSIMQQDPKQPGEDADAAIAGLLQFINSPEGAARAKEREAADTDRKRKIGAQLWRDLCPSDMQETDWNDSRLIRYSRPIARVRNWQFGRRGIYASGRSGRGKSRAFWALMLRLLEEQRRLVVLRQTDVTRVLNRDPKAFLERMDELHVAEVLAWDDWGKFDVIGSRGETLLAELESLIDDRASNGRPTIITTNCKDEDILKRFGELRGEPILRRLGETCEVVNFGWE
jgi:DNA replication protein DnaC